MTAFAALAGLTLGLLPVAALAATTAAPTLVLATDRLSAQDRAAASFGPDTDLTVERLPEARLDEDLGLLGPVAVRFCPVASESPYTVYATAESAQELLDDLNIEAARSRMAGLEQTLSCLAEPPDNERLWQMHFLSALIEAFDGNLATAEISLRRALVLRPGERYDPAYPPDLGERYVQLQAELLAASSAVAHVATTPAWNLWIDGQPVVSGSVSLVPGRHLMQLKTGSGMRGWFVDLKPGDSVVVGPPDRLAARLAELGRDERAGLAAQLLSRLGRRPDTDLWFDDGDRTVRLSAGGGAASAVSGVFAPRRRLELAIGGGYLRASDWNYGSIAADVSVGVVGPLRIAAFARPSIGEPGRWPSDAPADAAVVRPILTPFGLLAEVEFGLPVRPRLGVGLQLAANPDGTAPAADFLTGVHGRVGVDLPLNDAVAVRIQGELGNLGRFFAASGVVEAVISLLPQKR